MKSKWYLSTLILILALLGFSQPQVYVPNQEIVVQFSVDEVTFDEAQNAILIVQKQLQGIGAHNIQVSEPEQGSFKFTYYSDIDVASIKEIFSEEKSLALGYTSYSQSEDGDETPFEEDTNRYQLNVFEIQKSNDLESDFNGILVELSRENDRLVNPNLYYSFVEFYTWKSQEIQKSTYLVQRGIALAIINSSRIIPEVRAGPVSIGNS